MRPCFSVHGKGSYLPKALELALYVIGLQKNAVTGRTNLGKVQNEETEKMVNDSGRKRHG